MKNLPRLLLLTGLAGFASVHAEDKAPAPAVASSKLAVGSAAPEYKPTAWIQGEPVTAYEKGKVYIIECWATWCGPCVAMIPHLNDLHKKFADKGLVIIGTNVWEHGDGPKEKAESFVKKQGEAMSYRVSFDDPKSGLVTRDFLKAAGVNGIPHAFVVRDGNIIWKGHPAGLSDTIVAAMLAGTYDPAMAIAEQKENEAKSAKIQGIQKDMAAFIKEKKFDEALKKVDELEAATGPNMKAQMDYQRAMIAAHVDVADGVAKMSKIVSGLTKNRGAMSSIGKALLLPPFKGDKGAGKLALECAKNLRTLAPGAQSDAFYKKAAEAAGVETAGEAKPAATTAAK